MFDDFCKVIGSEYARFFHSTKVVVNAALGDSMIGHAEPLASAARPWTDGANAQGRGGGTEHAEERHNCNGWTPGMGWYSKKKLAYDKKSATVALSLCGIVVPLRHFILCSSASLMHSH